MGPSEATSQWTTVVLTSKVDQDTSRTPSLVGEVPKTDQLPDEFVEALLTWFRFTKEYRSSLSQDGHSGRGLRAFLGHLTASVYPVPIFSNLALLSVNQDGTVHLLHYLLFLPVRV